jgi:hypothetical protein
VTIRNRKQALGRASTIAIAMMAAMTVSVSGCSWLKRGAPSGESIAVDDQTPIPAAPASIQIAYAKTDDTLQSVVVSQFTGANVLRTRDEGGKETVVVRFDGGVPIWKFHANRSLLNPLSAIETKPYHLMSVEYGKLPAGFTQDNPEAGPPPPLDAGGYYVFAIERASGVSSFQAVKVGSDFTLQAYDAEPRAGSSYKLCCDVAADFAAPTPSDDETQPASMPSLSSPDSGQP